MRKKTVLGIFRFASMVFLNIWKGYEQKTFLGIFRFVSVFFLIFEKSMSKKLSQVFSDLQVCFFKNIYKMYKQKIFLGIFRFVSMLFLNIWKRVLHAYLALEFICMPFINIVIFKKPLLYKGLCKYFQICKYLF